MSLSVTRVWKNVKIFNKVVSEIKSSMELLVITEVVSAILAVKRTSTTPRMLLVTEESWALGRRIHKA